VIRQAITTGLDLILRIFFRRLEVTGQEHVPARGPVLFIINHPNALVDPVVLLCRAGRPVSFLAKEPLFRMPVIGHLARALDSIPVYRRMDQADTGRNRATFDAARALLARGGSLAVAPEGTSHSDSRLKPFRTGAARIALGAATTAGLDVVPAGLFYTSKTRFRSSALLCFGEPIHVAPVPPDPDGEPPAKAVRALTGRFETALGALTLQADHHEALGLVQAAQRIFTSAQRSGAPELAERLQLQQRLAAGHRRLREEAPERLDRIESRIARYDAALREADLTPELLPASGYRAKTVFRVSLRALIVLLVLLPLAGIGLVLHAPGWLATDLIARRFQNREADIVATIKALGGILFFPLTWALVAMLCGMRWGWPGGLAAMAAGPLTGFAALCFLERLDRLAGGARGLLLALTGRQRFLRLLAERRAIHDDLVALGNEFGV
jgi:1-acyl-sn-glycerol-3-phosphate acyltransferase